MRRCSSCSRRESLPSRLFAKADGISLFWDSSFDLREPKEEKDTEERGSVVAALFVCVENADPGCAVVVASGFTLAPELVTHFLCLTGIVCQESDMFVVPRPSYPTKGVNFCIKQQHLRAEPYRRKPILNLHDIP